MFDLERGAPVVLYLRDPKEKIWGALFSIHAAGIVVRGLDLAIFDEWMRQEARGDDTLVGPTTLFYPIGRLERMERDESVGPVLAYFERFEQQVGRSVLADLRPDRAAGG